LSDSDDTPAIWEGMDLLWIAFAMLDIISELTEYQVGASRKEIIEKILPLAHRQVVSSKLVPTEEGLNVVLNKVFDHLVNRSSRYLPFRYAYFDAVKKKYRSRKFWLIKTVYTGEGQETLFTLTDEGYAAYFGLHETSALDAAAIGNLRIKLLIERGNVDDAIAVADGNRKQCARKALDVRNTRRLIQRNIYAVDFDRIRLLTEEGVTQATDIQKEGSRLHNMVIENLQSSKNERHHAKLVHLAEQLEQLNDQLMKLSGELQRLPEDYHHHSHKLFRRRLPGIFPAMDDVMGRVFQMTETDASAVGREFIARIDPPSKKPVFDPAAVIEACDRALERQSISGDQNQTIFEVDGSPIERFVPLLSDELIHQAFVMIHTLVHHKGELLLSAILKKSIDAKISEIFPLAVAMAIFQSVVERRLAKRHQIWVELPQPRRHIGIDLSAQRRYWGDELVVKARLTAKNKIP
jgi:hypothetical protein